MGETAVRANSQGRACPPHFAADADHAAHLDRKERVGERQSTKVPEKGVHLCNVIPRDDDSYLRSA